MVSIHRTLLANVHLRQCTAVLLETPYAFQENVDDVSTRARGYFARSVGLEVTVLGGTSADDRAAVRAADWVFAGPGSPSYALTRWRGELGPMLRSTTAADRWLYRLGGASPAPVGVMISAEWTESGPFRRDDQEQEAARLRASRATGTPWPGPWRLRSRRQAGAPGSPPGSSWTRRRPRAAWPSARRSRAAPAPAPRSPPGSRRTGRPSTYPPSTGCPTQPRTYTAWLHYPGRAGRGGGRESPARRTRGRPRQR